MEKVRPRLLLQPGFVPVVVVATTLPFGSEVVMSPVNPVPPRQRSTVLPRGALMTAPPPRVDVLKPDIRPTLSVRELALPTDGTVILNPVVGVPFATVTGVATNVVANLLLPFA